MNQSGMVGQLNPACITDEEKITLNIMIFFLILLFRRQSNNKITFKTRLQKKGASEVPFKEDYKTRCCRNSPKTTAKQGVSDELLKDDCKGRYYCITLRSRLDKWQFSITACRRDYSYSCGSPCGLSDTPGERQARRPASCKPL